MKLSKLLTLSALLFSFAISAPSAVNAQTSDQISSDKATLSVDALLDLNTASSEQLAKLPGLGKKKADAIISYRKLNGNFTQKEELVNVKGIGSKLMSKLSPLVTVSKAK